VKYPLAGEIINDPSLQVDGNNTRNSYSTSNEISKVISDFTGIAYTKIVYFTQNFGLIAMLKKPSIMGITKEQEVLLLELMDLLLYEEDGGEGGLVNV